MSEMEGKICLITGSNSGIGKATALGLAKKGATVVMACRNRERGEKALNEIKRKSGNDKILLMIVDLSSQKSIHQFAKNFKKKFSRLHVLINNAGVHLFKREETVDGFEMNFAVNYLAPFLLTNLLLDTIKESTPARIINVSSRYHIYATLDFDDLQSKKSYRFSYRTGADAYCKSKLALTIFTYELAKRLDGIGVTVNCLCPGVVRTNLIKEKPPLPIRVLSNLFIHQKTSEEGAETSIYLASSPDVEGVTGKFFIDKKEVPRYQKCYDKRVAQHLWKISEKLTGLK